jgi:hypothetical protein
VTMTCALLLWTARLEQCPLTGLRQLGVTKLWLRYVWRGPRTL